MAGSSSGSCHSSVRQHWWYLWTSLNFDFLFWKNQALDWISNSCFLKCISKNFGFLNMKDVNRCSKPSQQQKQKLWGTNEHCLGNSGQAKWENSGLLRTFILCLLWLTNRIGTGFPKPFGSESHFPYRILANDLRSLQTDPQWRWTDMKKVSLPMVLLLWFPWHPMIVFPTVN